MKRENKLKILLVIAIVIILILLLVIIMQRNNNKIQKQELLAKQLETGDTIDEYIAINKHLTQVSNNSNNRIEARLIGGSASTSYTTISDIGLNYVNTEDFTYSSGVFTALKDIDLKIIFLVNGFRTSWGEAQCGYGQILHNGTAIANLTRDGQEFTTDGSYINTISLSKGDTLTVKVRTENGSYTMGGVFLAYEV